MKAGRSVRGSRHLSDELLTFVSSPLAKMKSTRIPVIVVVGGLQRVLDRAVVAQGGGSRSLDDHVCAAHRLCAKGPALLRRALHVPLDARRRILQVALRTQESPQSH